MKTAVARTMCTIGLMGASMAAMAGEPKTTPPQEPVGFITGAVIGGFAAGPIGAVVGAGLGTWLGNRVHRASEARAAEVKAAKLEDERQNLQDSQHNLQSSVVRLETEKSALITQQTNLLAATSPDSARNTHASEVLDGLTGDVLFRTGSAQISPDIAHQLQTIAQAVTKSPQLKVRVDGYADPRGSDESNMQLSKERAQAVRDLLLAAGVPEAALVVNAYGKTQSVATDADGFALERRVRLTLGVEAPPASAQTDANE